MVKIHVGTHWIETTGGNKGDKDFQVLDCIHIQRNENNTLYITRSQFDTIKDNYYPEEHYILKKTTKHKIANICMKLNEIRKDVQKLGGI